MKGLVKNARKTVRYTEKQAAKIEQAALKLSERTGEIVEDSEIIRVGSLQYADSVLSGERRRRQVA